MNHVFMGPKVLLKKKTESFYVRKFFDQKSIGTKNLLLISAALVKNNKNIRDSEHRAFKCSKFQN